MISDFIFHGHLHGTCLLYTSFSHAVENPHLWSAEDPALYELEIELLDDAGHLVEVTGQKVGFRKFELKNNRMLLNGKRIVVKGANRHEFSSIDVYKRQPQGLKMPSLRI